MAHPLVKLLNHCHGKGGGNGKKVCNIEISTDAMFDVMVKRFHEYKRQLMNILQVIYRYLLIKDTKKEARKFTKKVVIFGGKAAPGYYDAKAVIALINAATESMVDDYLKRVRQHARKKFVVGFGMDLFGSDGLSYVIMLSSICYFSFALTRYKVV